jgi:hypothetical protein
MAARSCAVQAWKSLIFAQHQLDELKAEESPVAHVRG